jgi:hypothetical protein
MNVRRRIFVLEASRSGRAAAAFDMKDPHRVAAENGIALVGGQRRVVYDLAGSRSPMPNG